MDGGPGHSGKRRRVQLLGDFKGRKKEKAKGRGKEEEKIYSQSPIIIIIMRINICFHF